MAVFREEYPDQVLNLHFEEMKKVRISCTQTTSVTLVQCISLPTFIVLNEVVRNGLHLGHRGWYIFGLVLNDLAKERFSWVVGLGERELVDL